jgi:methylated-DNA-protein-cysteine methyltransferase-like protein
MKQPKPSFDPERARADILALIRKIPRGRVASYSQVAWLAGYPGRARFVGRVLSEAPLGRVPWHRVINAQGRISLPRSSTSYIEQQSRLIAEGVEFRNGRVNLTRFGWQRNPAPVRD